MVSSALYGIVHFFERPQNPSTVEWFSGLLILGQMLRGFADWQALLPGLLNLAIIGVILCIAFERSGTLFFPFGIHAGLIFSLKSSMFVTEASPSANLWVWGTDKVVDGWMAFGVLLLLLAGVHRYFRERAS